MFLAMKLNATNRLHDITTGAGLGGLIHFKDCFTYFGLTKASLIRLFNKMPEKTQLFI